MSESPSGLKQKPNAVEDRLNYFILTQIKKNSSTFITEESRAGLLRPQHKPGSAQLDVGQVWGQSKP
jgi:hypothetical protein